MKKLLSLLMASVLVLAAVPTAFAAEKANMEIVKPAKFSVEEAKEKPEIDNVELHIKLKDFYQSYKSTSEEFDFTIDLNGAYVTNDTLAFDEPIDITASGSGVYRDDTLIGKVFVEPYDEDCESFDFIIKEDGHNFVEDDEVVIVINDLKMKNYSEGASATIDVHGDFGTFNGLTIASVVRRGISVNVAGKNAVVAEEGKVELKTITIKSNIDDFTTGATLTLKIKNGFEIISTGDITGGTVKAGSLEEDNFVIENLSGNEVIIKNMVVEALEGTKVGTIGKIEVSSKGYKSATDEAVVVIKDEVVMSVDDDFDVPKMYSGTDSNNTGLDTYQSHEALTVTIEETVVNAWDLRGGWTLELPKGVYVTDKSEFTCENIVGVTDPTELFAEAYEDGKFKAFDFDRNSFEIADGEKAKFEITLDLIAEPGFEGKVELVFKTRNAEQKVVIAEFVKPYIVEADQNKINSEYRTVVLDKNIVIKETEEELWSEGTEFAFDLERITFNKDTKVTGTNVKVDTDIDKYVLTIEVDEPSDDEKAEITVSNITLNMDRNNLPLGDYELTLNTTMSNKFMSEDIFGTNEVVAEVYYDDNELFNELVRKDFVSVVDEDELKIVVPIGSTQIYSNEKVINLDVPAYINEAGYTMLPIRAVANACGISDGQVVWNDETKTVTIFYNNRIVSMSLGEQAMHINGVVVPTASKLEIVNGRSFIPMRDLALALGISEINWDPVNRVATLG